MDASSTTISQPARPKKRTGTSKYDFIKVKVWLGEDLDHYYILSRFLICRMLTVTRIPYIKAVKIALETKKHLVDHNLHDVTQAQLEDVLFSIVRAKGFDEAYIDCYRMVTQFYQSRQPLCIIICGAAWTGKSTLAQQLASRINIPNVMQTDVIYELLRSGPDSTLHSAPLWARPGLAGGRCCDAALVREFRREAGVVRCGMEGDLIKTLSDGKPIIIEGLHLDPGLYIPDFGSRGLIMLPARPSAALAAAAVAAAAGGPLQAAAAAARSPGSSPLAGRGRYGRSQTLPTGGAAAAAAAAAASASATAAQQHVEQEGEHAHQQQQQRQRRPVVVLRERSASASAEVSISAAGPLSPGSLVSSGRTVSAEAALGLHRQSSAAGSVQQQQGAAQCPQDLHSQQPQRLLRVSEETSLAEQQLPSLPPLPPLRLRRQRPPQDVLSAEAEEHAQGFGSSSSNAVQQYYLSAGSCSGAGSSVQQPLQSKQLLLGTPFADVAAAGAAAAAACSASPLAAAGAADVRPMDRLFSGPDELPVAMTGEQVQVCAAAAEAAALQQHRQEQQAHQQLQQQLQQQQVRDLPGSPFSSASDVSSLGVGGGSPPCISQEHSTTEVVSRVCSCASLGSPVVILSQEPSAADVTSPTPAAAAAAAGDGLGCGAMLCKQLSGGGGRCGAIRVRRSARIASRYLDHFPEELVEAQQQQQQQQQQQPQEQHPQQQQQLQPNGARPLTEHDASQLLSAAASAPAAVAMSRRNQTLLGAAASIAQADPVALVPSDAAVAQDPDAVVQQQALAAAEAHNLQARPQTFAAASGIDAQASQVDEQPGPPLQQQQQTQQVQKQDDTAVGPVGNPTPAQKGSAAETEPVGKPLFVPIVVFMDEADHALMADEALAHLGLPSGSDAAAAASAGAGDRLSDSLTVDGAGSNGGSSSCMHSTPPGAGLPVGEGGTQVADGLPQQQSDVTVSEALQRVRLLQEYLCAYEAQGLPVVKVSYGAFGEALDKLHEYVLQCIKVAMQSRQSG